MFTFYIVNEISWPWFLLTVLFFQLDKIKIYERQSTEMFDFYQNFPNYSYFFIERILIIRFITLRNRTQRLYLCLLFFNIFFSQKVNFPEGMGGLNHICGKSGGGGGGVLHELPSVVGLWIFSGTTQYIIINFTTISKIQLRYKHCYFCYI